LRAAPVVRHRAQLRVRAAAQQHLAAAARRRAQRGGDGMRDLSTPGREQRPDPSPEQNLDQSRVPTASAAPPPRSAQEQAELRERRTLDAARLTRARVHMQRTLSLLRSVLAPVLVLALWALTARSQIIAPRFFPPPSRIAVAATEMALDGELWSHTWPTLLRLLV